jgi:hypothetical protein
MANIQSEAYDRLAWEPGFIPFRFNCGKLTGDSFSQAVTWGSERKHAGVTDLAVLVYGQFMVWLEVKQPGEKHLDSQVEFATEVVAQGGNIYTIRTLDELERLIQQIREKLGND